MSLCVRGARVVTGDEGPPFLGDVRIEGARIAQVAPAGSLVERPGERTVEAGGRVLMPGFVDAHTHCLYAGSRLDEWEARLAGKSYLEILQAGGGILSTVRAVRRASAAELEGHLRRRLALMLSQGTTTVEVKSGYGLSTEAELAMLRAIQSVGEEFPGTVVPTALLGHALDPELPDFVERVVSETLPAVHEEFSHVAVDAYCEQGAWSVADCRRLFEQARSLRHPLRLHVDQFSSLGGVALALELEARSVDHLEASGRSVLDAIAASTTYAVVLPVSGFHTDRRYADARYLLDRGALLVLATNDNPGSSPCCSMPFVIALAVRELGLSVHEAIVATTSRPADLLGLSDRGRVATGARADLILLRHADERELAHDLGGNPVTDVIVGGVHFAAGELSAESSAGELSAGESSKAASAKPF